MAGQTAIEKIAQAHAVVLDAGQVVRSGDYIEIRPKRIMTHDNTGAVIPKFLRIMAGVGKSEKAQNANDVNPTDRNGASPQIADPTQPVFAMDHDVQNTSSDNLAKYAKIQQFARKQGVVYHPPGRGIAHQVMVEEGYVTPGSFVVGSDSHSNLYGAIAALGTPVVRTDAAAIWATGTTWWQVPPVTRVELTGALRPGVTGKDIIITLCGYFNCDEVLNHALEFAGDGVGDLSVEARMTIANMTTEWGALVGMFPFDETLRAFLLKRADHFAERLGASGIEPAYTRAAVEQWWRQRDICSPDDDAKYAQTLTLDLSSVSPFVSGPNEVKTMRSAHDLASERVTVNKAYLLSCVNARMSDLRAAAAVLEGKRVAPGVELYLAAASSQVQEQAMREGVWRTLVDAGAIELPPGCGACIGLGKGTLEPGEVGISATNRNFQGRMGSREALCYLASPVVVAASAVAGFITAPDGKAPAPIRGAQRSSSAGDDARAAAPAAMRILHGFPERITGRTLYLPKDNLNTDGIYGKDVTYRDDITYEQQGQYAMRNYDPDFQKIACAGDILVGGRNFGSGSSREQAATALKSKGVRMVIAASFSQTYKRNAFNNGFLCVDCPELVDFVADRLQEDAMTQRTIVGPNLIVDFATSQARCEGESFHIGPVSPIAQELVVAGGSEAVVQRTLAKQCL